MGNRTFAWLPAAILVAAALCVSHDAFAQGASGAPSEVHIGGLTIRGCPPSNRTHGIGVEPYWACVIVHNTSARRVMLEANAVTLGTDDAGVPSDEQRQNIPPHVFLRADERLRDSLGTHRPIAPGEEIRMLVLPRTSDTRRVRVRFHVRYWHDIELRVGTERVTVRSEVGEFRSPRRSH